MIGMDSKQYLNACDGIHVLCVRSTRQANSRQYGPGPFEPLAYIFRPSPSRNEFLVITPYLEEIYRKLIRKVVSHCIDAIYCMPYSGNLSPRPMILSTKRVFDLAMIFHLQVERI